MSRCKSVLLSVLIVLVGLASAHSAEFDKVRLQAIRPTMQKFVDAGTIAGAVTLVARHDGVVSVEAVGCQDLASKKPMQPDTLFRIASMTKPMTAVGIMILAEEGKLSVEDAVEKHLPEFHGQKLAAARSGQNSALAAPSRPITIRDLLTHTSGMSAGPELYELYQKRDRTLAQVIPEFAKKPLDFEPGSKWAYCNIGIDTLGRIIEVVSGQSYEQFMESRVFKPLGMSDTGFYLRPEQAGRLAMTYGLKEGKLEPSLKDIIGQTTGAVYPIPAGGAISTAPDLARFYRMMLNRGTLDGKQILRPESVAAMTRLQTGKLECGFTTGMGFGFGWAVVREPEGVTETLSKGTFGHGGAFGTQGWIDPAKDLALVMLIQRVGLPNADQSEMRRDFQTAAVAALAEERIPDAKAQIVPPTPQWEAQVRAAAPAKPTVAAAPRKLLVFSRFTGFDHKVIPHVDRVFEILSQKSGAFETTISLQIESLTPENLAKYDVLVLNNNCSKAPRRNLLLDVLETEPQYKGLSQAEREAKANALEQSLLDFVAGGKGLVVIHGAPTLLNNSAKFTEMVGGAFDYHPANQEVTVRTVDESHPLVSAFKGKGPFIHRDEPYCFNGAYEKFDFRPLLSMDTQGLKDPKGGAAKMVRYVAWIKPYGKGRVFYCSPSHFPESYTSPTLLRFMLDGTQYASGDLKCDDSPLRSSGK